MKLPVDAHKNIFTITGTVTSVFAEYSTNVVIRMHAEFKIKFDKSKFDRSKYVYRYKNGKVSDSR